MRSNRSKLEQSLVRLLSPHTRCLRSYKARQGKFQFDHFVEAQRHPRPLNKTNFPAAFPDLHEFPPLVQFLSAHIQYFSYLTEIDVSNLVSIIMQIRKSLQGLRSPETVKADGASNLSQYLSEVMSRKAVFETYLPPFLERHPEAFFIPSYYLKKLPGPKFSENAAVQELGSGAVVSLQEERHILLMHEILASRCRRSIKMTKVKSIMAGLTQDVRNQDVLLSNGERSTILRAVLGDSLPGANWNSRFFLITDGENPQAMAQIPIHVLPVTYESFTNAVSRTLQSILEPEAHFEVPPLTRRVFNFPTDGAAAKIEVPTSTDEASANWTQWVDEKAKTPLTIAAAHRVFDGIVSDRSALTELLLYVKVLNQGLPGLERSSLPLMTFHESETIMIGPRHPHFALSNQNRHEEVSPDCIVGTFSDNYFHLLAQIEAKSDGDVDNAADQMKRREERYLNGRGGIYNPFDRRFYKIDTSLTKNCIAIPRGFEVPAEKYPNHTIIEVDATIAELLQAERGLRQRAIKTEPRSSIEKGVYYFAAVPAFGGFIYPSYPDAKVLFSDRRYFKILRYLVSAEFFDISWNVLNNCSQLQDFREKKRKFHQTVEEFAAVLRKGMGLAAYCMKNAAALHVETASEDERDVKPMLEKLREHLRIGNGSLDKPFMLADVPDLGLPGISRKRLQGLAENYAFEFFSKVANFEPHLDFLERRFTEKGMESYRNGI